MKLRCRIFGHRLDVFPMCGGSHRWCSRCSARVEVPGYVAHTPISEAEMQALVVKLFGPSTLTAVRIGGASDGQSQTA